MLPWISKHFAFQEALLFGTITSLPLGLLWIRNSIFDGAENRWPTIVIGWLCSSFRSFLPRLFLCCFYSRRFKSAAGLLFTHFFSSSLFSSVTSSNIKTGGRIIICQIPSLNQYVIGLLLLSLNDHNPVNVIVSCWVLFFFAS